MMMSFISTAKYGPHVRMASKYIFFAQIDIDFNVFYVINIELSLVDIIRIDNKDLTRIEIIYVESRVDMYHIDSA